MKAHPDIIIIEVLELIKTFLTNLKIPFELIFENKKIKLMLFKNLDENTSQFKRIFDKLNSLVTEMNINKVKIIVIDSEFPTLEVATSYSSWLKSGPYDCGNTCRVAFSCKADKMTECAASLSLMSEANGSAMRNTPIPCIFHKLPYKTIAEFAREDARLSHPSKVCQDVNALYSIAIAYLINNPGDNKGAIELVENWKSVDKTVKEWLEDSKQDLSTIDCNTNIGHVKHAFTLAFHFLRNKTDYETAIFETLKKNADTDTNACIVGGLIAALHGYSSIPDYMKDPVLKFDPSTLKLALKGNWRPSKYKPAHILEFAESCSLEKLDYIKGALVGALVGDAAGVTLEFFNKPITSELAKRAMKMPGGGVFNVAPGQISDDGELTLSLCHALRKNIKIYKITK